MRIRPAIIDDSPGISRVQVDSYRTAYAGIFPPAYLDHFTYQEQVQDWSNWFSSGTGDLLFVAVNEADEIVGYALSRPGLDEIPPFDSELVALHVVKAYQRQGIGRQLIAETARQLAASGCTSLVLWTPEKNAARPWYEKLGGRICAEKNWDGNQYFGVALKEVAYRWLNIEDLL
jgi:ribosomal protein S18 acetylase RimI-like enzyme